MRRNADGTPAGRGLLAAAHAVLDESDRVLPFDRGARSAQCEARAAGDHALRWTARGLLEAEKKFRQVKGYRELEVLHRRLNLRCPCDRCQEHRRMISSLTQQAQVA